MKFINVESSGGGAFGGALIIRHKQGVEFKGAVLCPRQREGTQSGKGGANPDPSAESLGEKTVSVQLKDSETEAMPLDAVVKTEITL